MGEKTISFILYPSLFQTRFLTIINDNNGKIIKQNRYNKYKIQQSKLKGILFYKLNSKLFSTIPLFVCIYIILTLILIVSLIFLYYLYWMKHLYSMSSISSLDEITLISNWINPNATFNYVLLYKASRDGDSSDTFHEKCDYNQNTITLILTTDGWKFGGYTDSTWLDTSLDDEMNCNEDCKFTSNSFIFSLNLKKKYPSISKTPPIRCGQDKGPTFGNGPDFMILNKCLSRNSLCNSPTTFGNMATINEFNGGKDKFIVKEMEVFYVKNIKN